MGDLAMPNVLQKGFTTDPHITVTYVSQMPHQCKSKKKDSRFDDASA